MDKESGAEKELGAQRIRQQPADKDGDQG